MAELPVLNSVFGACIAKNLMGVKKDLIFFIFNLARFLQIILCWTDPMRNKFYLLF